MTLTARGADPVVFFPLSCAVLCCSPLSFYTALLCPSHQPPLHPPPLARPAPAPQVPLTTARVRVTVGTGTAKYVPEHNAVIWKVRRFGGGSEVVFNGEIELIPTTSTKVKPWVRPPITVDFQVPMFTASGLHVRSLKIYERSNYETTKWVRYLTRSGTYQHRTGAGV
jgi:hypothetical protein